MTFDSKLMLTLQLKNVFYFKLEVILDIILWKLDKKQRYALYLSNVTRRPNIYIHSHYIYLNFSTFHYRFF